MNSQPNPKKSLGQHWLADESILGEICALAGLTKKDTVLEIGPGLGSLTRILSAQAGQVVAIEIDYQLSKQLNSYVQSDNLEVLNGDILTYDLTELPVGYKLVANIPYYLTGKLLSILSESSNPPIKVVLLVQKEVAERIGAKPGEMSLMSITTQFFWEVSLGNVVPAKMFTPPPKVDSQVVVLTRRLKQLFPIKDNKAFFRLVRVGFSARRKTLLNSIANGLRVDKNVVSEALTYAKIDPSARPQTLNLSEWYQIYKIFSDKKII